MRRISKCQKDYLRIVEKAKDRYSHCVSTFKDVSEIEITLRDWKVRREMRGKVGE